MQYSKLALATAIISGVALAPPVAAQASGKQSLKPDCPQRLVRSANHHRRIVVKRHGNGAAGRDIVRYGRIRANQHATAATCKEIRRYRNQLIVLHTEPKLAPLLVRKPTTPYRPPAGTPTPSVAAGGTLEAIAHCESGGNPSTDTGNGFYGKYQFTQSTWASVGGTGNPAAASEAEQDRRAAMLYAQQGSAPWPVCGR